MLHACAYLVVPEAQTEASVTPSGDGGPVGGVQVLQVLQVLTFISKIMSDWWP